VTFVNIWVNYLLKYLNEICTPSGNHVGLGYPDSCLVSSSYYLGICQNFESCAIFNATTSLFCTFTDVRWYCNKVAYSKSNLAITRFCDKMGNYFSMIPDKKSITKYCRYIDLGVGRLRVSQWAFTFIIDMFAWRQVLLKVIWEERVAPQRIKRVANYWDRTALACCRHSKRVWLSDIRLDSAYRRMCPYAGVCCPAAKWLAAIAIAMLRLFCCVFALEFLFNPQFDLEPDYIIRKPLLRIIQRYILRREILSTFHTRVNHQSVRHFYIVFTPNCPLPFDDHHQNLIHLYRARPHSPPQTASRSNHPCHHCSHLLTDRWLGRMFDHNSASLYGATR